MKIPGKNDDNDYNVQLCLVFVNMFGACILGECMIGAYMIVVFLFPLAQLE